MTKTPHIALITGAAKRIGRELALHLANDGWDIALHYHSSGDAARALGEEISDSGQRCALIKADLAKANQVAAMMPEVMEKLGPPNVLINNASIFDKDEHGDFAPALFDAHMAVNLRAPLMLAGAMADACTPTEGTSHGNIINITDQRVFDPAPDFVSYTLSKIGLQAATRTMAQGLAPKIRVNAIAPGPVLKSVHQTQAEFEKEAASTPLGHGTSPEEICRAVAFILASPAMTGETIALDGGQRLKWRSSD